MRCGSSACWTSGTVGPKRRRRARRRAYLALRVLDGAAEPPGDQDQAVAADLDLVEALEALRDVRGDAAIVDAGAVTAAEIDDRADRTLDADLAVLLADLLVDDRDVGLFPASQDGLGPDDAVDGGRVVAVHHGQDEDVRRAERSLAVPLVDGFGDVFGGGVAGGGHTVNLVADGVPVKAVPILSSRRVTAPLRPAAVGRDGRVV